MKGKNDTNVKHKRTMNDRYINRIGKAVIYPLKAMKKVLNINPVNSNNRSRGGIKNSIKQPDGAFNVAHAKSITHQVLLPPYTSEDYKEFEQVWQLHLLV